VNRRPALVVHELASGRSRRLFRGRGFMKADGCVTIEGRKHTAASLLLGGMDAVAVDPAGEWLYFSPLTSGRLYRAPTAALQDFSRDEDSLAALVEDVGAKTMSDGMAFDPEGSLYMTDFEHSAIVRRRPDGALETVVRSPELLRWPDGVAFGPDGSLYVTASDVGRAMLSTKKRVRERGPYRVLRVSGEALRGSLR
jgi:sugar lactone lactonase YvrE